MSESDSDSFGDASSSSDSSASMEDVVPTESGHSESPKFTHVRQLIDFLSENGVQTHRLAKQKTMVGFTDGELCQI